MKSLLTEGPLHSRDTLAVALHLHARRLGCALVAAALLVAQGRARAEAEELRAPAFELRPELDLPIYGLGLVMATGRLFYKQTAFCAPMCQSSDVNAFDRVTAGTWSPGWQIASSVVLATQGAGAAALLFADEGARHGLNDAVVVGEAALASVGVGSMIALAVRRPRPFLYGDKAPADARQKPDAGLSFVSSHTAVSFALVTSTAVAMHRLHPGTRASWIVLAVGGAAGAFVATARVLGGMHFITDVMGGSVVGASLGVLLPALHATPVLVAPVVTGESPGLSLTARF
jgi:membrane-associated phospholipid phosphatase